MSVKTILAALALEQDDDPVAGRALQLAAQHGARLVLVHVVEQLPAVDTELPYPAETATIAHILRTQAIAKLERMASVSGLKTFIHVEPGNPHAIIDRVIREQGADLLVIGAGNAKNIREKLFGSTAARLVRSSPCPVLVVKRTALQPYRRVIAAVDFSPSSYAAVAAAVALVPNAALEFVHAVEIPFAFEQAMLEAGTTRADVAAYRKAKAREARNKLRATYAPASLPPDSRTGIRIFHDSAGAVLTRQGRSQATDLITLGAQGRNAVAQLVLGSVASKVLAAVSCDVLLARANNEGKD